MLAVIVRVINRLKIQPVKNAGVRHAFSDDPQYGQDRQRLLFVQPVPPQPRAWRHYHSEYAPSPPAAFQRRCARSP
jgi:hypothetical protein